MSHLRLVSVLSSCLSLTALAVLSGPACGGEEEGVPPAQLSTDITWESYAEPYMGDDIQEACKPVRYQADSAVPFKGSVILLHGFTACPQQYFEIAQEILVPAGYDVYLPLLPGQGKVWEGDTSNYEAIPGIDTWEKDYGSFLDTMASIAGTADGPVSLGGLSLGGALALWGVNRHPDLYDRVVLFAPFLALSKEEGAKQIALNGLVDLAGRVPGIQEATQSWGEGCYEERELGRAGICHFTASHLVAHNDMGKMLQEATWDTKTSFHFITAEKDSAIDNGQVLALVDKLTAQGISAHHVQYPAPTNHSMLSRYDNSGPGEDMFWLEHLKGNLRRLFKDGLPMVGFDQIP